MPPIQLRVFVALESHMKFQFAFQRCRIGPGGSPCYVLFCSYPIWNPGITKRIMKACTYTGKLSTANDVGSSVRNQDERVQCMRTCMHCIFVHSVFVRACGPFNTESADEVAHRRTAAQYLEEDQLSEKDFSVLQRRSPNYGWQGSVVSASHDTVGKA